MLRLFSTAAAAAWYAPGLLVIPAPHRRYHGIAGNHLDTCNNAKRTRWVRRVRAASPEGSRTREVRGPGGWRVWTDRPERCRPSMTPVRLLAVARCEPYGCFLPAERPFRTLGVLPTMLGRPTMYTKQRKPRNVWKWKLNTELTVNK